MKYDEQCKLDPTMPLNNPCTHYQGTSRFWVSFKTFTWLWHFVKHFVDLLVYMCLLAGWPLDFGLKVLIMILYVFSTINKEIQSWNIPQPYARSIR
jgi:hypothetical protein